MNGRGNGSNFPRWHTPHLSNNIFSLSLWASSLSFLIVMFCTGESSDRQEQSQTERGEFSHEDSNGKWLPRFLRMQILENSGKHPPNQRYPSSDGIYQRSFLSLPYIFLVTCPEWSIQGLDLIEMMERNLLVLLVEHIDWTEHYWNTLHWQLVIACIPMKVEVDVGKLCFEGGISLLIEEILF